MHSQFVEMIVWVFVQNVGLINKVECSCIEETGLSQWSVLDKLDFLVVRRITMTYQRKTSKSKTASRVQNMKKLYIEL